MADVSLTATSARAERATREVLANLKKVPATARLAFRMLLKIKVGELRVVLPGGRALLFEGDERGPQAELILTDYRCIGRAIAGGDIGFAEGYMAGDWDTPDLTALLALFSTNLDNVPRIGKGGPVQRFFHWIYHRMRPNTRRGAKKNIEAHYDLGNDFYEEWLDPTMTYSSARYENDGQSLADAQRNKYRQLADMIGLERDHHVLEIGCGWGGFAEYAARDVGARVTCLTLSPSQRDYAIARMERLQLSDKVEIKLQDYRDETGQYDRVASIEMFEAVGQEYWPSFFSKVSDVLKPGGKAGLQIISIRDDIFEGYSKRADFIQRYIFPGGILPSKEKLNGQFDRADLTLKTVESFALDYARTLAEWHKRFEARWGSIEPMGFDERFRRMWKFYLSYCEAGFRTGRIDVAQYALAKP
ncbi:MAG: SAM-dependent methyltransferase [Maricaulis sp.]|jgi:cyclopropane-fatty-acyl-phospholipid synthase|nr:SAM-dependent methyltransferase [Maricaulis sp.]HAQ36273.1 SAM-dependent methyltransferase [Alphaproteobacteria bacterium]|tara:strand:+ start:831 stop:2081 length:1251 start_codon:yes stop_codon:yes gene_type:complete